MDPNPRKTIRKNIHFLRGQLGALTQEYERRQAKYQREIDRLTKVEANATIDEARRAADSFDKFNWHAI